MAAVQKISVTEAEKRFNAFGFLGVRHIHFPLSVVLFRLTMVRLYLPLVSLSIVFLEIS